MIYWKTSDTRVIENFTKCTSSKYSCFLRREKVWHPEGAIDEVVDFLLGYKIFVRYTIPREKFDARRYSEVVVNSAF